MDKNPFEAALDRLREKGWIKDESGGVEGPNCILGALTFSGIQFNYLALYPILKEQYGMTGVSWFNDHPDTTFADVERVLEKAAVKWEEERVLRHD